jgi:transmembrane sensor
MVREALTQEMLSDLAVEEAAACFIARRAEGWIPSEEQLLNAWLAANEAHQRAYDAADRAWRVFETANGDEILGAMRERALATSPRTSTAWTMAGLAAAAVVVLALAVTLAFRPALNLPGFRHPSQGAAFEYASARGQMRELRLADGSEVTLDADSAISGRFSAAARSLRLERGRAFFAVAHDRSRPFSVAAGDRRVVAVGTHFDVDLAAGTLSVTLLEGHVTVARLDGAGKAAALDPGQQFVERNGRALVRVVGAAQGAAWKSGLIDFDDQPLSEAAAIMNRYGADQIVIRDPRVGAIRVSGQFRAGKPQRFAQTVAELEGLRVVTSAGQIELGARR